jgi:hypothetical protein
MTNERSSQSFCARPGCGIARTAHGFLAQACSRFVQPGSKEANASAAVLELVEDEPTVKVRTPSDAELFAEWKARLSVVL